RPQILFQTFRLQTQTGQSGFGIVRKCRKKLLDLSMTLLLSSCVIKEREAPTDQTGDQNAAFPQEHLIMPLKLVRLLDVKLTEQIELPQTEDQPPDRERDRERDPKSHEQDFDSVTILFHLETFSPAPSVRGLGKGAKLSPASHRGVLVLRVPLCVSVRSQ